MSTEKKQTIPKLTIHLTAGIPTSKVLDLVDGQKNAELIIDYDDFNYFTYIELENLTQEEIDTFLNEFKNIYPIELDYNYTPSKKAKPVDKKAGFGPVQFKQNR